MPIRRACNSIKSGPNINPDGCTHRCTTSCFFLPDPDRRTDQCNLRYILNLIIQYHTKTDFQDHNLIWELAEDTYLITLTAPDLVLIKCTLQQAVIYKPEQIALLKITTLNHIDQNKMILRLGLLSAKYGNLSPCAFKVMKNEETGITSLNSVLEVQRIALKFLVEQSPLLPKTLLKRLREDLEALRK